MNPETAIRDCLTPNEGNTHKRVIPLTNNPKIWFHSDQTIPCTLFHPFHEKFFQRNFVFSCTLDEESIKIWMSTLVFESKLKRHKISFSNSNGKIIIGKPKADYLTLLGLIVLPLAFGIAICLLLILNKVPIIGANRGKVIIAIFALLGTAFFNLSRMRSKKEANENLKILEHKTIKIKNDLGEHTFDANNIKNFEYTAEQIDEVTFEANLYLIDSEDRKHQILGFDDETEKYTLNDLKWFSEYLTDYTELKER